MNTTAISMQATILRGEAIEVMYEALPVMHHIIDCHAELIILLRSKSYIHDKDQIEALRDEIAFHRGRLHDMGVEFRNLMEAAHVYSSQLKNSTMSSFSY